LRGTFSLCVERGNYFLEQSIRNHLKVTYSYLVFSFKSGRNEKETSSF
jgi:hypothetical protein